MRFNNQIKGHDEGDLFDEFSQAIFMFDSEQQKRKQKKIETQKQQNPSKSFSQSMNPLDQNEPNDPQSFLDLIFLKENKQQQLKYNMQMSQSIFKRVPSPYQSEYSQKIEPHHQDITDKKAIDKTEMNRIYTKNYRLKKKQQLQSLKEENRFLKQKIDDLTFRLRQAELQINKLKHGQLDFSANFNTMKQQCIKQLQHILSVDKASYAEVYDLQQKFRHLVAFSNKPRLDMLNYLMSQLLQNLISDQGMYFIQSMQNKTGIWRENINTPLKKLDYQILQIINGPFNENQQPCENLYRKLFAGNEHILMCEMVKLKILWKKLYEDYLEIINQGMKLETVYRPLFQKKMLQQQDWILNSLKFKLHFQRNKYRKDIREIRQSWFRQIQQGKISSNTKPQPSTNPHKRCKIQHY